jgi:quinohemoprotein ethanol dehydrogenase
MFAAIVSGAYAKRGMPSYADVLPPPAIEAVHQYVILRAHDLKKELAAVQEAPLP